MSQATPEQIPRNSYSNCYFHLEMFLNVMFSRTAYKRGFTVHGISWRSVPQEILQGQQVVLPSGPATQEDESHTSLVKHEEKPKTKEQAWKERL